MADVENKTRLEVADNFAVNIDSCIREHETNGSKLRAIIFASVYSNIFLGALPKE